MPENVSYYNLYYYIIFKLSNIRIERQNRNAFHNPGYILLLYFVYFPVVTMFIVPFLISLYLCKRCHL